MPRLLHHDVFESRSFGTFEKVLSEFLEVSVPQALGKKASLSAATLGIAGPVVDQRVKTTNLPWKVDARALSQSFSIPHVTLLNDLVALGLGAIASSPGMLTVLNKGRPKAVGGTLAVIAAGTGLGEAAFVWDGTEHVACATEGSHVDFAPRNSLEDELLHWLRGKHGHVSYERVASGSTISTMYEFFVREQRVKETKAIAAEVASADDPNKEVVELAIAGRSEAAMRALDLWASVYGAETGNLALKTLSTAGVFVCGGVSARLAPILKDGLPHRKKTAKSPFVSAFLDKGRMADLVEAIPVAVCLESRAGLLGAATHAASAIPAKRRA